MVMEVRGVGVFLIQFEGPASRISLSTGFGTREQEISQG